MGVCAVCFVIYVFLSSPWPMGITARHLLAVSNCTSARSVGLAPARAGEPGYYSWHDADSDGIACEPYPR
ncbi:MAG: excalibur calcium-binding domain-containing protein [Alphaproteobacteria bacterium]|nr:excalibur calcium-binding domain-containing protein [Alphaproteobacteria bacterium]